MTALSGNPVAGHGVGGYPSRLMLKTLLQTWLRRYSRRLVILGMCLAILPFLGHAFEQALELAVHQHIGHDLPGDQQRHPCAEDCTPDRHAVEQHTPAPIAAVECRATELAARPWTTLPLDADVSPRAPRRTHAPVVEGLAPDSLSLGPPTPPPNA